MRRTHVPSKGLRVRSGITTLLGKKTKGEMVGLALSHQADIADKCFLLNRNTAKFPAPGVAPFTKGGF
jgi:hypothetical protein